MFESTRVFLWDHIKAIKPSFIGKHPHFNFITAHYLWVVGMTILSSILVYFPGRGNIAYVDALFFASGANTQAGLNTVDVNTINTFQQVIIYIFTMLSCPITLHGCVVLLRLYWFEKRFQNVVRDARQRRATLSKTTAKPDADLSQAERGVNGRSITILRESGNRITNDGIVLGPLDSPNIHPSQPSSSTGVATDDRSSASSDLKGSTQSAHSSDDHGPDPGADRPGTDRPGADDPSTGDTGTEDIVAPPLQQSISFAPIVTRSDGAGIGRTKFPNTPDDDGMAVLERSRDTRDSEVLRIPGPRDADRGILPERLDFGDDGHIDQDDADPVSTRPAANRRPLSRYGFDGSVRRRNPAIIIEEPNKRPRHDEEERRTMDDLAQEAKAITGTLEAFKFRKPRLFQSKDKVHHQDNDDEGNGARPVRTKTLDTIRTALSGRDKDNEMPYLSWTPTTGRNSQFPGLTLEQREELGGIEYRSLRTLALVILIYFWGFQLFGLVCMLPFILTKQKYGAIVDEASQSRTWWAFFTANSSFMDLGLTLTPDSMISFQTSTYVMMILALLIIAGNTGFPVFLRLFIWIASKIVPRGTGLWEELMFLLDHPRRCFTLLFPSNATWWLFWTLVVFNVVDLVFFLALDLKNPVVQDLPWNVRIADGLFQAASTRTAGFACLPINRLHPGVQVLYMIMMYISVFPIAISIRGTNVYEERSLGIYAGPEDDDDGPSMATDTVSYIGTHLRRQLSFDLWFVFLGLFFLAISEAGRLEHKDFNMFDVLFEVVSAYGTVGLSMGYATVDTSLCGQFSTVGKLIIVAMMIRGRHRGLPYGLDRAILLPSDSRFTSEASDMMTPGMPRTNTGISTGSALGLSRRISSSGRSGMGGVGGTVPAKPSTNIIAQLLHPGPTLPPKIHRTMSMSVPAAQEPEVPPTPRRAASMADVEDDDDDDEVRPVRRTRTYAGGY